MIEIAYQIEALKKVARLYSLAEIGKQLSPVQREILAFEALLTVSELQTSGNETVENTLERGQQILDIAKENKS